MKEGANQRMWASLSELPAEPPGQIQVIPWGRHETAGGLFVLDAEAMESVMQDFASRKTDTVVDYEHQTLTGAEAPAAGWVKALINKGQEGLWATVQWTERAGQYLRAREYRYLSPVFLVNKGSRKVVRFINAALTNQPAIDGMVPLINKDGAQSAAASCAAASNKTEEAGMEMVLQMLGLPEGLSASEVQGALMAMKQSAEQASELGKRVQELEAELAGLRAEGLVAMAMKEGKVTPAQRQWALEFATRDTQAFEAFVAKAPVAIRLGQGRGANLASGVASVDSLQRDVNRALGVSEEAFRKFNKDREV